MSICKNLPLALPYLIVEVWVETLIPRWLEHSNWSKISSQWLRQSTSASWYTCAVLCRILIQNYSKLYNYPRMAQKFWSNINCLSLHFTTLFNVQSPPHLNTHPEDLLPLSTNNIKLLQNFIQVVYDMKKIHLKFKKTKIFPCSPTHSFSSLCQIGYKENSFNLRL